MQHNPKCCCFILQEEQNEVSACRCARGTVIILVITIVAAIFSGAGLDTLLIMCVIGTLAGGTMFCGASTKNAF